MKISEAISICTKNGIRVYGVNSKGKMYVQSEEDIQGSVKPRITASKINHLSNEDLNKAVTKTYFFYAGIIINKIKDKTPN